MTFEEFLKKIYDNAPEDMWLAESFTDPAKHNPHELYFKVDWNMGGTVGSCWYDELRPVDPELEPELDALDQILEIVAPSLTFLAYKRSVRDVVERGEDSHGDYYGGHTSHGFKGFSVMKLYNVLYQRGLI